MTFMNKEKAWFLGYLLSDGTITHPKYRKKGDETHMQFICKYEDKEVMYKIKDILETSAKVQLYPSYKSPQAKLRPYDRKDIINEYHDIKQRIPEEKIKNFERHFIRGCFDGDGTLSYRQSRNSFRIGFIDQEYNITQWISNTICKALRLPHKQARWVAQNNVWEILWEGNIAKLIAFWLYHGDIENCCLERKLNKYRSIIGYNTNMTYDQELLQAVNSYIDDNNEIAFNVPNMQTLEWCKRIQSLLSFNTVPVFHNKGKRKYYHLYIPDKSHIVNMRDTCNKIA